MTETSAAVLIVDDDASKRLAIKAVLAKLNLQVVEADSGLSALRCVMERDFAVILLDVRMPDIDGFETAALIRRRKESEMTPIIFVTAFTSDEIASKARYVEGAVDFITAPVSPDELRAKVSVFVNLFLHAQNLADRAQEVQESADQLGLLTDAAPVGIFRTDADKRYVYTNARWSEISGISASDALGRDWETIFASTPPPGALTDEFEVSTDPTGLGRRFRLWSADFTSRVVWAASEPLQDDTGNTIAHVGTLTDVTAEAEAEKERTRFRALVQHSRYVIAIVDLEGSCCYASPGIQDLCGFTAEEFEGFSVYGFVHPDDAQRMAIDMTDVSRVAGSTKTFEVRVRTKDDSWIWVEMRVANRLDIPSIRGVVLNFHDISERKEAEAERVALLDHRLGMEQELRQSEQLFRGAFDASHAGIALIASDGMSYVDVNKSFCEMMGYTKAELLASNWQEITHPEDRVKNVKEFERLMGGGDTARYLAQRYRKKNGEIIWVEINDSMVRAPDGSLRYIVTHIHDVTDRDNAARERERLEIQLIQSQKMEAVGQLAGGIAHDFNNILSVILNYAQFASEGLDEADPRLTDIHEISKAGEKAAHLVHQLLAFSRKEIVEFVVVDPNEIVTGIFSILSRALGEDIALEFKKFDGLASVLADPGRLEQVLLNLSINARDAMSSGGLLEIETDQVSLAIEDVPPLPAGDYALITLRDSGTGMDAATRKRIFEPFFTTKPRGEGTGMGLSSAYGIIEQAGGCLRVESELGIGTTFTIYLPCTDVVVSPAQVHRSEGPYDEEAVVSLGGSL